ncbi:X2-like carbohydrate binding domain-containing protein [Paenibacillus dokdonensis]|uniref:X2-like carbohydrate binding domain-containing protein n=2 Tax=Paenibacillus dokdonensis TaxID=2567944 RepID=A0ABU6GWS5_9BACL|nr:X2-like carbohydrate binding domain-containing protein [Paenibacillus dokdonensis]MEC0244191.1 X2-like carbohydrate binding domain-containing protein [Paenibacillus dokdonensis]
MRGNVFYNIGKQAFKLANGRENIVENNLVIDSGTSIAFMARNYKPGEKNYNSLMSKFDQVPYQSEIWSKRYPTLPNILNDEPLLPKRNVVRNNIFVNSGPITGDKQNMELGTFENNLSFNTKDELGLLNSAKENFQIKDQSKILSSLPEFKPIPFAEMGIKAFGLPPVQSGLSARSIEYQQNVNEPSVNLSLNGNTLASIRDEAGTLTQGTDYVIQGRTVVITKAYLSNLPTGYHTMVFSFSEGNDAFLSLHGIPSAS